jgi:hypothetical protein
MLLLEVLARRIAEAIMIAREIGFVLMESVKEEEMVMVRILFVKNCAIKYGMIVMVYLVLIIG